MGDLAEFARNLGSGAATDAEHASAAEAVKLELRENSRTRRLRALNVVEAGDGIHALEIPRYSELDWSWEGARAFRSAEGYRWQGDIVEIDDVGSRVFVSVGPDDPKPSVGDFSVQPYEFLAALNDLLTGPAAPIAKDPMKVGLAGAQGSLSPNRLDGSAVASFAEVWSHSWGIIWGPPGTWDPLESTCRHASLSIL